jgi:hypothetical protein
VREDIDPRNLARRQPIAVFGTLGSVLAIGGVGVLRRMSARGKRWPDKEIDQVIQRLGGRVDKLKGKTRKRLRETLRKEIADVEQPPKPRQLIIQSVSGAVTAALTLIAQRFASRLMGDEELPTDTIDVTPRRRVDRQGD